MKRFFVCFAFFMISLLFIGCGEKSQTINGLQWSNRSSDYMSYKDAVLYCTNLNEGGNNDWRLPTISELRGVITNCPRTENGGGCQVYNNCMSNNNQCNTPVCTGCEYDPSGKYSKLGDNKNLWSLSFVMPNNQSPTMAWVVRFDAGAVSAASMHAANYVRCVR
ncbi:DUF1566 domain-containing protein [bacterium]|nr:DUF1566 domain-containing protein [bacterium]